MAMSQRPAILKLLVVLFSRTLLFYFKLRSPTSTFGKNILIAGFPLFQFRKTASVSIGDDVVFINLTQGNYAGLTKPCSVYVGENASLRIGSNTWFSGVSIYCSTTIEIGSHVMCGANTWIWDTDFHPLEWSSRRVHDLSRIAVKPIFIGDDVFIGGNSIILKGVTIGARSVIGAGSVVVRNIPEDEIWAGNPARFIKRVPRRE